jgi:pimeloyl-ACP methyl ester carboxylesterase
MRTVPAERNACLFNTAPAIAPERNRVQAMVVPARTLMGLSRCRLGEVELAFAEAGPADGELVILLHGFPEYWGAWRKQITGLAEAGFRVAAPDQRGYGLSSKPSAVADYDLDRLAADIIGLARHLGHGKFSLVGHDWGGSVAWWIASRDASMVRRMVVLNAPHPAVWREAMGRDWRQYVRSWYVRVMRLPRLPEAMMSRHDYQALTQALRPAKLTQPELDQYLDAWAQPGALTGMINWYRAFMEKRFPAAASFAVDVPTLIVWGDRDPYALPELAESSARLCTNVRVVHIPECTHWVHHEQPDQVNELLVGYLSETKNSIRPVKLEDDDLRVKQSQRGPDQFPIPT